MLELLDQVEEVISVEDSVSDKVKGSPCEVQDGNSNVMPVKVEPAAKGVGTHFPKVPGPSFNCNFLVLEVFDETLRVPWFLTKIRVHMSLFMQQLIFSLGI